MINFYYKIILLVVLTVSLFAACKSNNKDKTKEKPVALTKISELKSKDDAVRVSVYLNKKKISIVENLDLVIELEKARNVIAIFPRKKDLSLTKFSIAHVGDLITQTGPDYDTLKRSLRLTPEELGTGAVKPFKIKYYIDKDGQASDNKELILNTDTIEVVIVSYTGKAEKDLPFLDKLLPESLPPDYKNLVLILFIILAIVLIAAIVFFIIYRIRKSKRARQSEIKLSPYELAIKAFQDLLEQNLVKLGKIELFHRQLTDILRDYIENQYNIRAPEQTTEEFIQAMSGTHLIKQDLQDILKRFLYQCDLIKFAKYEPPASYNDEAYNTAVSFVQTSSDLNPVQQPDTGAKI